MQESAEKNCTFKWLRHLASGGKWKNSIQRGGEMNEWMTTTDGRTVVPQEGTDSGHFQIILNRGARRPDILIGGVGNMQFYPINEKTLELWHLGTLMAIIVPK